MQNHNNIQATSSRAVWKAYEKQNKMKGYIYHQVQFFHQYHESHQTWHLDCTSPTGSAPSRTNRSWAANRPHTSWWRRSVGQVSSISNTQTLWRERRLPTRVVQMVLDMNTDDNNEKQLMYQW